MPGRTPIPIGGMQMARNYIPRNDQDFKKGGFFSRPLRNHASLKRGT